MIDSTATKKFFFFKSRVIGEQKVNKSLGLQLSTQMVINNNNNYNTTTNIVTFTTDNVLVNYSI